jgi:ribosomal protein S18 acetylase RimI-like enzyme
MTAEDIVIRPARPGDIDQLTCFSAAMARETEQRTLDIDRLRQGTLAVFERADRGTFYVAEHRPSRVVVGQCLITYEWSDWRNAQFWWIQSVYVDPQWRRRGVYRRLHEAIRQKAQSTPGVCGIRLYVEHSNSIAQSVYEAMDLHRAKYQIWEVDFVL